MGRRDGILSACEKRYELLVGALIFFDVVRWVTMFGTLEGQDGFNGELQG